MVILLQCKKIFLIIYEKFTNVIDNNNVLVLVLANCLAVCVQLLGSWYCPCQFLSLLQTLKDSTKTIKYGKLSLKNNLHDFTFVQAGEKAKKRKALLLSNKKKNEKNRIDYLDKAAHDHYRTCKLASVLSPRN